MEPWTPPNSEYPPPKPGEPEAHRAARLGDHESLRRLASAGVDLNAAFNIRLDPGARPWHATPLMVAAGSGDGADVETVRLLLELGADPTIILDGRSAATYAAAGLGWNYRPGGDAQRLRFLLESGSPLAGDPESANRMLCDAAGEGDIERVRILVEQGLDVNGFWDQEAAKKSHRRMEALESRWMRDTGGDADLDEFLKKEDQKLFDEATSAPFSFEIPIHTAAESGSAECVRYLIDKGANPRVRDNRGRTPIYRAGSKEVIEALLQAGLSLDDHDQMGWSPLVEAVSDGMDSLERIRWLIELGANVNGTHDRGYTVFMCSVGSMARDVEICKLLVAAGADPFALSELGYNAFHAAIDVDGEANAEESVRSILGYLASLGLDIHHRNKAGETPLERAKRCGTPLEQKVLRELGA